MLIILISPAIALLSDYFLRRHSMDKGWTIGLISSLVAPSILLELTGYSFSTRMHSYIPSTLFLAGIQLGLFTMVHVRLSVKVVASIAFVLIIGFFVVVSLFASSWAGGAPTIIQEAKVENYTALTLGPILYSHHKVLRVKKTALSGMIQKKVYEKDLPDSVTKNNCEINISDGSRKLVYNLCENKLSLRD